MKTEQKIYLAAGLLLVLGGTLWMTNKSKAEQRDQHSAVSASADLPSIAVPKDDIDKITKVVIKNADKSDVTLEKKGDAWELVKPVAAKANAANVKSLLENLKELKTKETIDPGTASYGQYELGDEKAVHVTAYKGGDKAIEMYLGKSGSRGQMARIGGKDGVYVVGGYSSYLYTREVKNWRETAILKFEDQNAIQLEITNEHGRFGFSKNDEKWSSSYTKRDKDGKLEKDPIKKWEKFDEAKVKDMLRAYKALAAEDFGDDKSDTGIADAEKEGGVVRIKLKDNAGDITMKVGKKAKGSSRFAVKDGGDGTVFVLSSWAADWATAERSKFEKSDDKKKDKDKKPEAHGGEEDMMPSLDE